MRRALLALTVMALALAVIVTNGASPSSTLAQQAGFSACPQTSAWSLSVWQGSANTTVRQALAACAGVPVDTVFLFDAANQAWLYFFAQAPESFNTLLALQTGQVFWLHGGTVDLSAVLPKKIAGTDLVTQGVSGDQLLNLDSEAWRNFLASVGKTNGDVSLASALTPEGSALKFSISAFRVAGLDWRPRLEAFREEITAASEGVIRFDQVTLGGKSALRAARSEAPTVAPAYYYAA